MIQLTRWRLRQICDVLRASVWDPDRNPNLLVLVEAGPGGLTISARNDDEAVAWHEAGTFRPQTFAQPSAALLLEPLPFARCWRVGWCDGRGGWSQVLPTADTSRVPPFPALPSLRNQIGPHEVRALDEAMRTASPRPLWWSRVELRGTGVV